jgi:predicted phosphodiesterase
MEVAIIADVHSNLPALEAVLKEVEGLDVFSCGDVVGYNPFPNESVEIFRKKRIKGLMGNHDYAVISGDTNWFNTDAALSIEWTEKVIEKENLEYLSSLPKAFESESFIAFHGSPRDPLYEYVYSGYSDETFNSFLGDARALILAHTHLPFVKKLKKGIVINPGSVGQPRDGDPRASYATLDTEKNTVRMCKVSYDVERVVEEIIRKDLPKELAERLYKGR